MVHQAGVRTVVVGGIPGNGPMQAVSGSRGAAAYSADILDSDMEFASAINNTAMTVLPQNRDDSGMDVSFAGFNLRDQMRQNDTVPLQFQYEAADCRIYYTFANAYNLTRLRLEAATAMFDDPSLCVPGSVGYTSSHGYTPKYPTPPATSYNSTEFQGTQTTSDARLVMNDTVGNGIEDARLSTSSSVFTICNEKCGSE